MGAVKQTFYLRGEMYDEVQREAARQGRSCSWLVRKAWEMARDQIRRGGTAPESREDRLGFGFGARPNQVRDPSNVSEPREDPKDEDRWWHRAD
jgi:uncharacterized small protein (TIGR04563 family)